MPFYNEFEEVIFIPLLSRVNWISFIENQPSSKHVYYLKLATQQLQEAYIEKDPLKIKGLQVWEQKKEYKAEELVKGSEAQPYENVR